MKQYEAFIILYNPTKEDGIKEAIDHVSNEITAHGGTVQTVQNMDRTPFARAASTTATSPCFANLTIQASPDKVPQLHRRLAGLEEVFRVALNLATGAVLPTSEPAASQP